MAKLDVFSDQWCQAWEEKVRASQDFAVYNKGWQGDIGWMKVAGAGYDFAFAKGTEGVGWTDTMFHQNMAEGDNAGVYMGIYHFARPEYAQVVKYLSLFTSSLSSRLRLL